jgi:membrane associated rhomboid family serine protease
MIPIRDSVPSRTFPVVNFLMIGLCTLVFVAQLREEHGQAQLVERYGMIPVRVLHPDQPVMVRDVKPLRTWWGVELHEVARPALPSAVPPWLTALTCIFLHGGWMHFLGNMWFLYIFGDNVEDLMGHLGYLVFYLAAGVAASLTHLITNADSTMPTIGASGAIAGVMGAYFCLYPKATVLAVIPIIFFIEMVVLPAPIFLGLWFVLQFFQGIASVTATEAGGVAWWAHIGGFAAGYLAALILGQWHVLRPKVETVRPEMDHITHYRAHPFRH